MIIYQRDISRKLDGLEESLVRLRNHLSDTEWEIQVAFYSYLASDEYIH